MKATPNPKATPRSSERFKAVVAQPISTLLVAFFVEDIVAQPCLPQAGTLAVLFAFFLEASSRKTERSVLQIPFCRE